MARAGICEVGFRIGMLGDFPALAGVQCGVPQMQSELEQQGKEWQGRVFLAGNAVRMRRMRVAVEHSSLTLQLTLIFGTVTQEWCRNPFSFSPQPPPKLPSGVFTQDFQEFVNKW